MVKACNHQKTETKEMKKKTEEITKQIEKDPGNESQPLFWLFITTFISVRSLCLLPHFPQKLMAKPTITLNRALG